MTTFIVALALCIFPIFGGRSSDYLGLSVVNDSAAQQDFAVTVRSSEGMVAQSGNLTIPAGAQRARLLQEILGSPLKSAEGWIRVDGLAVPCRGYLLQGSETSFAGFESASGASAEVALLPHVSVNTGFMELGHTETSVGIVNPNVTPAAVTVELFTLRGVSAGKMDLQVPVQGSRTFRASEAFAAVLPNNNVGGKTFEGYIRLTANVGIVAWQRIDTPLRASVLRGRPTSEMQNTSQAVFPHFVFGGDYGSTLNVLNPGSTPLALELSAQDDQGRQMGEVIRVTLAAGEARRASVGEFFRVVMPQIFPQPNVTGHVRVREVQGQTFRIAGDIQIFRTGQGAAVASMLSWISDAPSAQWLLPFVSTALPYVSGYSVVNSNELLTVQTDVTVDLLDQDGKLVNRTTLSLSPGRRHVSVAPGVLPGGFMRIRSNFPVHVLGTIGTRDGQTLDELPRIP
jgi:hypothetical protein